MNQSQNLVAVALEKCAAEAIHRLGTIQPHGALVVTDEDFVIRHVSENLGAFLSLTNDSFIGQSLNIVLGEEAKHHLTNVLQNKVPGELGAFFIETAFSERISRFSGQAHIHDGFIYLELEHSDHTNLQSLYERSFTPIRDQLLLLEREENLTDYLNAVAEVMQRVTGIDRVMIYRFDSQWDGEVIVEKSNASIDKFLGHHFPAADIPPQARELYLKNRIRLIADVNAGPVAILPSIDQRYELPLDLTYSVLRSFSPAHLEYLSNMGVSASLSVSLVAHGRLWGLIACHNYSPYTLPPDLREIALFIGQTASLKIAEIEKETTLLIKRKAQHVLETLADGIANGANMAPKAYDFLNILGATGAIISINHHKYHLGTTPELPVVNNLIHWLQTQPPTSLFATDNLVSVFPQAANCGGTANGLLVCPLEQEMSNYVLWFRSEITNSIKWAGNPKKELNNSGDDIRISPRKSFSAWIESYGGRSAKWSFADIEVAQGLSLSLISQISKRRAQSTQHLRDLDLLPDAQTLLGDLNTDLRYRRVSKNSNQILGFVPNELSGHKILDFVFSEDHDRVLNKLQTILQEPLSDTTLTFRHSRKDGRYIWMEIKASRIITGNGIFIEFLATDVTERQRYNEALENIQRKYQHVFDPKREGVISIDPYGQIATANEVAHAILGYDSSTLIGQSYCTTVCMKPNCPDRDKVGKILRHSNRTQNQIECRSDTMRTHHGHMVPVNMWSVHLKDANGRLTEVVVFHEIDRSESQPFEIDDHAGRIGMLVTDRQGTILSINDGFTQITGYPAQEAIGNTPALIRSNVHSQAFYEKFWNDLATQKMLTSEIWNRRKNGEIYPQLSTIFAINGPVGQVLYYVALIQDISSVAKAGSEKNHFLPEYDALTGLPTRLLFEQRLDKRITEHGTNTPFALAFFSLDNLAAINDVLGHISADRLLYLVANRLTKALRQQDTIARWGGSKFVVMLNNVRTELEAREAIEHLLNELAIPFSIGGKAVNVSSCIGICFHPRDGADIDTLMRAGDTAQAFAKNTGSGVVCFYNPELSSASLKRFEVVNDLRSAIKNKQLFLVFQPQIEAVTGLTVGLEALVRWQHPIRGLVSPAEFIPIAEESGQIDEIGAEVLNLACEQIFQWRQQGDFNIPVGINVSPKQLKPVFLDVLGKTIRQYAIPPELIEIEITESALQPTPEIRTVVSGIKSLGVTLAIDDFGTGYSSLSHLKLFPFDRLKIDKSFVDGLPGNNDDIAIAQAILALGKALNVNILAEGVENALQANFLKLQGVDVIQGYFYSRPIPSCDIPNFLAECIKTQTETNCSSDQELTKQKIGFIWDSHYETGIEIIDQQHHALVDMVNHFGDSIVNHGTTNQEIESLFNQLASYSEYHFSDEEALMEDSGVNRLQIEEHKKSHRDFLAEVTRLHEAVSTRIETAENLLKFLTYWLAYHILGADQFLAKQLLAIRSGKTVDEAAAIALKFKTDSTTEPLLVALNGLFHQVSERNRQLTELNRTLEHKVDERTQSLSEANQLLEQLALTDVLTGLPNRRHAMARLGQEWSKSGKELACMMIDADGFKQVNDQYGHEAGDNVLKHLANTLRNAVRTDDMVFRLGGDEFLVICPSSSKDGVHRAAEHIRKTVSLTQVNFCEEGKWVGSISVGIAARQPDMKSLEDLIRAADRGVYIAKRKGRNCVGYE